MHAIKILPGNGPEIVKLNSGVQAELAGAPCAKIIDPAGMFYAFVDDTCCFLPGHVLCWRHIVGAQREADFGRLGYTWGVRLYDCVRGFLWGWRRLCKRRY